MPATDQPLRPRPVAPVRIEQMRRIDLEAMPGLGGDVFGHARLPDPAGRTEQQAAGFPAARGGCRLMHLQHSGTFKPDGA